MREKVPFKGGGRVGVTRGNNENPNAQKNLKNPYHYSVYKKKEKGGF